jgi:hypothetical protein
VRLRGFVKNFGEKYFTTEWIILFCKLCSVKVTAEKRFTIQQYCNTAKHISCANTELASQSRQPLRFEKSHSSAYEFSKNFYKIMVSSNIPLHKVEAARFRKFLEKFTTHPIPTESTLRKNYLAFCCEDAINKIRNSVGKKIMGLH